MDAVTWTTERVDLLTQLWDEGLPSAEIGRRLGLTKNAVIGKVHRIALSPRVIAPEPPPKRNFFEFSGPSCLWPFGHPNEDDFHFCGAHPMPGKPYCAEHAARAYIQPKEERPREEKPKAA
jgi:GcrA cell cycle regulator